MENVCDIDRLTEIRMRERERERELGFEILEEIKMKID